MTKPFARFARREGMSAPALVDAARRVASGHADVDLGAGLYKLRLARAGGGKSGGYRTLLSHRAGGHVFFLHGFAKHACDDVDDREIRALKALGALLHGLEAAQINTALAAGELREIDP